MADLPKLFAWLVDLKEDFGDEAPDPEKLDSILRLVREATGVNPIKYVGGGDNAVAYLTDEETVLKFTVDHGEATLWGMLQGHDLAGMVPSYGAYHLTSKEHGDTIVYVVHVGYGEGELDKRLIELINAAQANATTATKDWQIQYKARTGQLPPPELRQKRRTLDFVKAFQNAADKDPRLEHVADTLIDLSDMHNANIYDLAPPNFRLDADGNVVIIDPSVPDLSGPTTPPKKLLFEQRMTIAMYTQTIYLT